MSVLTTSKKLLFSFTFLTLASPFFSSAVTTDAADCSYKNVPIYQVTATATNYQPKCVTLDNGSTDLYKLKYDFTVTGVSNAADGYK
ncbi:hypothetical protein [Bacillus toyonensis]|uniref:hypothetical protein n=1 Tax=Bacillus toyonensis TaxID=155322 RepID=UPI002E241119|nr:hypothetical protein [Bacillus toyonensis]